MEPENPVSWTTPPPVPVVAIISALIGACVHPISRFVVTLFTSKKRLEINAEDHKARHRRRMYRDVVTDLQKQIFGLREQMLLMQKDNITYIHENAQLKANLILLTEKDVERTKRLIEVEGQLEALRNELIALHAENAKYAGENSELRQQVIRLKSENEALLNRLRQLEKHVAQLTERHLAATQTKLQETKDAVLVNAGVTQAKLAENSAWLEAAAAKVDVAKNMEQIV